MTGSAQNNTTGSAPAELLRRVAKGDRRAFSTLFLLLAPRLKAYLMRLGADAAAAEDLAQDVMLVIWHKAAQFDPRRSSVMTWAFVIARNRRIDSLRREHSTVTYGSTPPETADGALPQDEIISGGQDDERVRVAIASLSAEQQEVIKRSFFEEQPHSAIAEALGLPLGTVKSRLRLAFSKLRSRMENFQ